MTKQIWVTSDTHLGQTGMPNFTRPNGDPQRPWATIEEHDEALVENWNSVVQPGDRVYHLGDLAFTRKALLETVPRLNGNIVLIKGNHDIYKLNDYALVVEDVRACKVIDKVILTHIPVHTTALSRWHTNIHGHLHHDVVYRKREQRYRPDPRYKCVSVEQTNYRPVLLEQLITTNPPPVKAEG